MAQVAIAYVCKPEYLILQSQTNRPQGASEMQLVAAVAQATRAAAEAATAAAGAAGICIFEEPADAYDRPRPNPSRKSRRRLAPRKPEVLSASDDPDAFPA